MLPRTGEEEGKRQRKKEREGHKKVMNKGRRREAQI